MCRNPFGYQIPWYFSKFQKITQVVGEQGTWSIPHAAQRVAKKLKEKKNQHRMLKSLNALFGEVTGTFYLLASYAGYPETS